MEKQVDSYFLYFIFVNEIYDDLKVLSSAIG